MCAKIKTLPKSSSYKYKPKGVSKHQFEKVHWPYFPAWAVVGTGAVVAGAAEFGLGGAIFGGLSVTLASLAIAL